MKNIFNKKVSKPKLVDPGIFKDAKFEHKVEVQNAFDVPDNKCEIAGFKHAWEDYFPKKIEVRKLSKELGILLIGDEKGNKCSNCSLIRFPMVKYYNVYSDGIERE